MHHQTAHATMKIYTCQLTYQIILVQDIDKCRQDTCWGASSAPVKALSASQQLLNSYLEDKRV